MSRIERAAANLDRVHVGVLADGALQAEHDLLGGLSLRVSRRLISKRIVTMF